MRFLLPMWAMLLLPWKVPADGLPPIETVFIIVMENHNWSDFKGRTNAPYLNDALLPMASWCEQYYNPPGLHPSLPNYIWLEAGTNFGILDDDGPEFDHQSATNHLVSLLERSGISWKAYHEDISGTYVPLTDTNLYAVRHNPFAYFDDVTGTNDPNDPHGLAHIRPYAELAADLTNGTVARYNFIKPNVCHDGHDSCPPQSNRVLQTDDWLAAEVPKILASPAYARNGALFITWDEGGDGDGPIGMIALSPLARGGGYFNRLHYTHSSLVRTLQEIFGVTPLLNDASNATGLSDLFSRYAIIDAARLAGGELQLACAGVIPGRTNVLQASPDLFGWTPVSTNVSETNNFVVVDSGATNFTQRFYRLRQLPE